MADVLASTPNTDLPTLNPAPHLERRGSGTPVLLLHGWGASTALFQPTMAGLEHAFTLIAPDLPGFGATPPPPQPWSVRDYALWVIALLDSLDLPRVHVIAHSNGARIAIKIASEWPQRLDKIVLTGAAGIRPPRDARYYARVYSYKALRRVAHAPLTPPLLRRWLQARALTRGSGDYQNTRGTMRGTFVQVVNEDLRDLLPTITAPTLLIWGDHDTTTPLSDGQLMESLIPDAGLVVLSGGHYAYLDQSPRFCRIVETFFAEGGS